MQASNIVLESTEVHLFREKLKKGLELLLEYSHFSSYPLHSTQIHKYLFTDETCCIGRTTYLFLKIH